jgi:predicted GIY-YIG superfamily endonuclease
VKEAVQKQQYWMYILQSEQRKQWIIATALDMQMVVNSLQNEFSANEFRLVYYRSFDDMLSALSFKLLISTLRKESVKSIICKMNPLMLDISKDFSS